MRSDTRSMDWTMSSATACRDSSEDERSLAAGLSILALGLSSLKEEADRTRPSTIDFSPTTTRNSSRRSCFGDDGDAAVERVKRGAGMIVHFPRGRARKCFMPGAANGVAASSPGATRMMVERVTANVLHAATLAAVFHRSRQRVRAPAGFSAGVRSSTAAAAACVGPRPALPRRATGGHAVEDLTHAFGERDGKRRVAAHAQPLSKRDEADLLHSEARRHHENDVAGGLAQALESTSACAKLSVCGEPAQRRPGFDATDQHAEELPQSGAQQTLRRAAQRADRGRSVSAPVVRPPPPIPRGFAKILYASRCSRSKLGPWRSSSASAHDQGHSQAQTQEQKSRDDAVAPLSLAKHTMPIMTEQEFGAHGHQYFDHDARQSIRQAYAGARQQPNTDQIAADARHWQQSADGVTDGGDPEQHERRGACADEGVRQPSASWKQRERVGSGPEAG